VTEADGVPKAAEYIGERESYGGSPEAPNVLVIYVDGSGAEVVEGSRLQPRHATGPSARRAAQAGKAAVWRADRARRRGQAAARSSAELRTGRMDPYQRVQDAIERAFIATDAAREAEAAAVEALDRAAEAWERAASAQQRLAEAIETHGDVRGPAHRLAATETVEKATDARKAAIAARRRVSEPSSQSRTPGA
jgi:hypothetical protein